MPPLERHNTPYMDPLSEEEDDDNDTRAQFDSDDNVISIVDDRVYPGPHPDADPFSIAPLAPEDRRGGAKQTQPRSRSRSRTSRMINRLRGRKGREKEGDNEVSSPLSAASRSKSRPRSKSRSRVEERNSRDERSKSRTRDRSKSRTRSLSRSRSRSLTRERSFSRPRERSNSRPRERSKSRPREHVQSRPRSRSRGRDVMEQIPRTRSRSRPRQEMQDEDRDEDTYCTARSSSRGRSQSGLRGSQSKSRGRSNQGSNHDSRNCQMEKGVFAQRDVVVGPVYKFSKDEAIRDREEWEEFEQEHNNNRVKIHVETNHNYDDNGNSLAGTSFSDLSASSSCWGLNELFSAIFCMDTRDNATSVRIPCTPPPPPLHHYRAPDAPMYPIAKYSDNLNNEALVERRRRSLEQYLTFRPVSTTPSAATEQQ